MSVTASRCYGLFMALTNLTAAFVLVMMCIVNNSYGSPNLLVSFFGPLAAAVFAIISIMWAVDAFVRRREGLSRVPSTYVARKSSESLMTAGAFHP